jgi:DNA-binding response OmpR family regulator
VEQHHGTLEVESEQGQGSTFWFCIPVNLGKMVDITRQNYSEHDTELSEVYTSTAVEKANTKLEFDMADHQHDSRPDVLLVEDDGDLVSFVEDGLSELFNVSSAYTGKEGYEMAKKLLPDIILSDIMMPEMDGFEMGKLLRNDLDTSHIPLVFLTAKTMRDDEIEGLRIGAVDYIYKPFNMVTLRLKLLNILESRGNARESFRASELLEPEIITLSSLDEEFLRNAVAVVDKYMDDPNLDVEKLSEHLSLSSNQTYRKIKALTGYTAKEFIRVQRLKIAAQLLTQKKRTISEIIYMVGFSSPSYFSRCFKEQYGCTPSEFIEREEE